MMATDGWTIDFGDNHKTMGWGGGTVVDGAGLGVGHETPATIDPCIARDYWSHKYCDSRASGIYIRGWRGTARDPGLRNAVAEEAPLRCIRWGAGLPCVRFNREVRE